MNTKTLLSVGLISASIFSASAFAMHQGLRGNVTKTVLDNGIQMTHSFSSEEEKEQILSRVNNMPEKEGVTQNVSVTQDSVTVTLTTDNAEMLEKLQNLGKHHENRGKKMKHMMGEASFTTLDNGVQMTHTFETAEQAQTFADHVSEKPTPEGINHEVSVNDTIVTITLTTDDAEILEKLQNRKEKMESHGNRMKKMERKGFRAEKR